ncbi:MAG: sodium:proton antiporter [Candidatus Azobacteroides sp.]|nr:sodium:proton antiporter [Candidatus Azobacteroides sp.]
MSLYYSFAVLIIITTIFSYINARFLKLPSTIGIMIITMIFSAILVIIGYFEPEPLQDIYSLINHIDFTQLVMGGMLYFLLFAGAIQININDLKEEKTSIIVFSTLSVIISTFIVGFSLFYLLQFLRTYIPAIPDISLIYCLLFGALISPTDAVAVLGILKQAKVPKSLETKITGEALFNDGMAVVLFTLIYNIALGKEEPMDITFTSISLLLVREIVGALIVGVVLGYIGLYAMKTSGDDKINVLITLSVVLGGFMASQVLHISGPLTMVFAGILIGNLGRSYSEKKHLENNFVNTFWELTDNILNALLFLLIGFEVLLIPDLEDYWILGILTILIVLLARYLAIKIPTLAIPFHEKFTRSTFFMLVWGGLRGGVSIALALSIGDTAHRNPIVAITYFVAVFSIVVQGLTVGKVAKKIQE